MQRRELIQIALAGAFAPGGNAATKPPIFFKEAPEYRLLEELCEVILPADSEGPGSKAAGVCFYIDRMIAYATPAVQSHWHSGLGMVYAESVTRFGKGFVEASEAQRHQLVTFMAKNEGQPKSPLEKFFASVKRLTFDGFAFSDIAKRDFFHYKGEHGIAEFEGCTHPEHKSV